MNNLVNRYKFLQKDSEILNDKLSYLSEYRDQDKALYRKELKLKEEALKSLIAFVPDTCREVVADFLLLIENLSKEEELDEEDVLRHQELRLSLEYEAQEWKDSI